MKPLRRSPVLRFTVTLLVPVMMLYAFYIQFHGEESPGGGFQAGAIFASAFVAYALVYGVDVVLRLCPYALLRKLSAAGVLIYLLTGVAPILTGGKYLEYAHPVCKFYPSDHCISIGNKSGIFLIELGVGLTVFSVILLVTLLFIENVSRES